jgi:hypothetical protein
MSARDHALELRGAVVKTLRDDPGLLAHGVDRRVHAEQPPEFQTPWVRLGRPRSVPFEATGWAGSEVNLEIHAFDTASDRAHRLGSLIVVALDGRTLALDPEPGEPEPYLMELYWEGTEVLEDTAAKGDYHAVIRFAATVASET